MFFMLWHERGDYSSINSFAAKNLSRTSFLLDLHVCLDTSLKL
uniref:Uncharacterized protein n=1 Tax=Rhizophora mucronata TaxID=61149 RepID=A0A2P2NNR4_RHIMU